MSAPRSLALAGVLSMTVIATAIAADAFQPEARFKLLFNGENLTGWKTKSGDSLDGKTEAYGSRFVVKDGLLVIDPKVKGDVVLSTAAEYEKDVVIRFDWLPGPGCNNDLFLRGTKFDLKDGDVKNLKEGEWNAFEISVVGDKVEFKNNGELQKTLPAKSPRSALGIRAEFGPIQFRNLRFQSGS